MNEENTSIDYKNEHIINVGNKAYLDHNEEDNTLELIMTFNDVTKTWWHSLISDLGAKLGGGIGKS